MVTCVAVGCTHRTLPHDGGITFHSFPKDNTMRVKWVSAVGRKDWEPSKYSKICSAHFREEDIDRTSLSCVRIREGAVPSLFPGSNTVKKRTQLKRKSPKEDATPTDQNQTYLVIVTENEKSDPEISIQPIFPRPSKNEQNEKSSPQKKILKRQSNDMLFGKSLESPPSKRKADDVTYIDLDQTQEISLVTENETRIVYQALETPGHKERDNFINVDQTQEWSNIPIEESRDTVFVDIAQIQETPVFHQKIIKSDSYVPLPTVKQITEDEPSESLHIEQILETSPKVIDLYAIINDLKDRQNIQYEYYDVLQGIASSFKFQDERLRSFATMLHFISPKAYNYVRETIDSFLPHPRSLSTWYQSTNGDPGFSKEALEALKNFSTCKNNTNICSLIINTISIKKQQDWDGIQFYGSINVGSYIDSDNIPLATEILFFHLVFINCSLKIPVGYFLVNGVSVEQVSSLVIQCLSLLYDANITVASLNCDITGISMAVANHLGCSISLDLKTYFLNPWTNKPVFFIFDPSSMIKMVRDTFAHNKLFDSDNAIEWKYIERLHNFQKKKLLYLTNKPVQINFNIKQLELKLASQSLATVIDSLRYLQKNDEFYHCKPTINFLTIFNNVYHILNSKTIHGNKTIHEGNFKGIEKSLLNAKNYILRLKLENGDLVCESSRKTGFLGFLTCIHSTIDMYHYFVGKDKPLKYLPMFKMSQHHLIRFIDYVQSQNHTTAKEFKAKLKIIMQRELSESMFTISGKSPEDLINSSLLEIQFFGDENKIKLAMVEPNHFISPGVDEFIDINYNIVEHIARHIVSCLLLKILCKECIFVINENENDLVNLIYTNYQGSLLKPSEEVKKLIGICEKVFSSEIKGKVIKSEKIFKCFFKNVTKQCIGINIFKNNSHFMNQEIENSHFLLLIKSIAKQYFTIKHMYTSKAYKSNLQFLKTKQYFNELRSQR